MKFKEKFKRVRWLLLVLAICAGYYYQFIRPKEKEIYSLQYRLKELEKEKDHLLCEKEDLKLRIQSQTDPAWIEMVLMKELGVVPEGYSKVHFQKQAKE
jgi:hypothetical protein